jgi:hypothetical protein
MQIIESMMMGVFLALYCGLSAEGASRARECLLAFAEDPDAYPNEISLYRYILEQTARAAIDESLRAQAQLH